MKRLVTVFGGTGFLGRRVVRHLLNCGMSVRTATRHPPQTNAEGVEAVRADIHEERDVAAVLKGAAAAVNAVSLYVEHGKETFASVHVEGAARVARLAAVEGVSRLVHVSGIGSDPNSRSAYIRARGEGESAVQNAYCEATIVRSAVMIAPDDAFLTTIVKLARALPVYPLFGAGKTRLQPVFVDDVAEGIARVIAYEERPAVRYDFAGPRIYEYRELVETVAAKADARTVPIPVLFPLWKALATATEFVPGQPLTRNQVELMGHDNVADPAVPGLPALGVEPTPIGNVLELLKRAQHER